jgi:LCP family protein required for cell wall assembly
LSTWSQPPTAPGDGHYQYPYRDRYGDEPWVEPRRTWGQRLLIAVAGVCIVGLVVTALGLTWGLQRYKEITFLPVEGVEEAVGGEPVNWLLVGSDSREGIDPSSPNAAVFVGEEVGGKRTDTIMIARVDQGRRTIDLLSVPRDLWVPIAGTGGEGRVNSAFNGDGGEQRLVATVEESLGLEINNYAEINFVGFQAVIDALGGVPVWFDTPVRDPNSGLDVGSPGCHLLDGFSALAFARSRSLEYHDGSSWRTDPTGDLGRTARQQFLLSRLADTARARIDPTDFGTIDRVVKAGGRNLVFDDGSGVNDLLSLGRTFSGVGAAGITRHALPVTPFRTAQGAAVLALQTEEAQPVLDVFRGKVEPPPVEEVGDEAAVDVDSVARDSFRVDVMNGAQVAGIAQSTADTLAGQGFLIGDVGNADPVDGTVIRHPSDLTTEASVVASVLGVGARFELDDSLSRVRVIIGPDLAGAGVGGAGTETPPSTVAEPAAVQPEQPGENEVGVVPGAPPPGTECA